MDFIVTPHVTLLFASPGFSRGDSCLVITKNVFLIFWVKKLTFWAFIYFWVNLINALGIYLFLGQIIKILVKNKTPFFSISSKFIKKRNEKK